MSGSFSTSAGFSVDSVGVSVNAPHVSSSLSLQLESDAEQSDGECG